MNAPQTYSVPQWCMGVVEVSGLSLFLQPLELMLILSSFSLYHVYDESTVKLYIFLSFPDGVTQNTYM